ncbi:MAG: peptide-methionine (S)-S-oxide reductase MsrA [Alphaproteobacteria bacterium]
MRMTFFTALTIIAGAIGIMALIAPSFAIEGVLKDKGKDIKAEKPADYPVATLAGGCFWCLESEFRAVDGILHTRVGYTGGQTQSPTYQDITTGQTGHAEAVEITFDPTKITYKELITFFLEKAHNPTQLNRQGVDVGTQYRSDIFYHNEEQKQIAHDLIQQTDAKGLYSNPIVTKISPAEKFWLGEEYHQQYYEKYEQQNGQIHPRVIYKKRVKALKGN